MKPLYIEATRPTHVALDGPALLVRREGEADRLYPLQRLGRIISDNRVEWESQALIGAAAAGIPILFCDRQGQMLARITGPGGEPCGLIRHLEEVLQQNDGASRYRDWLDNNERHALLELARAHPWLGNIPEADPVTARMAAALARQIDRETLTNTARILHSRVFSWVSTALLHLGIDGRTPHLTGGLIDLPADLARILRWQLIVPWAASCLRIRPPDTITRADAGHNRRLTTFYQRLEPLLEKRGGNLIARLQLWAASTAET